MQEIFTILAFTWLGYIAYKYFEIEKDYNNLVDENDNLLDENTALRKELERIKFYLSKI